MWYFSADWHLDHTNIIKYCKRPFLTREEEGLLYMVDRGSIPARDLRISSESTRLMTDTIINSTNAVVQRDDTLVIIGDFCWTPKDNRYAVARSLRDRINCQNIFLIWGNHDHRSTLQPAGASPLFTACYDHYVFNVDGQNIFVDHYPARSWDRAHHGSWMLYGHVHNLLSPEDNGELMPYEKQVFSEGFQSVLNRYGLLDNCSAENDENRQKIIDDLLAVCASLKGIDLTLDVGVDNRIRGEHIPFGTPWSMADLRQYMAPKKVRWEVRQEGYRNLSLPSSLKGGNPNANPKF